MSQKKELYIGIDLGYERAMVSLFHTGMEEPETISTVSGEEKYQIPTAIFAGRKGSIYYGDEAVKREESSDGEYFDGLYAQALAEKEGFLYHDYLVQYIRRLIRLKERYDLKGMEMRLAIAVPEITSDSIEVMEYVRGQLGFSTEQFLVMDYGESFFSHTYHQDRSIWMHDTMLFDFSKDRIELYTLHCEGHTGIQNVTTQKKEWAVSLPAAKDLQIRDEYFSNIIREAMQKKIVSGVYFIGDGFDGGWLKESLRVLGPNKRVFLGKNLYTRGACYAAYRKNHPEGWKFFYDCDYKLQGEISMKVRKDGEPVYVKLVEEGRNWFAPVDSFHLICSGDPVLELLVRQKRSRNAKTVTFPLEDLPDRPAKTIRLKVMIKPCSGQQVSVLLTDDGFGELFASSKKSWEFSLTFGK